MSTAFPAGLKPDAPGLNQVAAIADHAMTAPAPAAAEPKTP